MTEKSESAISDAPTAPADPVKDFKPTKSKRTWKQRLKIAVLVILILGLLVRIGFNVLLPTVVRKVANAYDLDCEYDRMTLSVLGGNAQIWNLVLRPKTGGDSIVRAEYIHGSISAPALLRGRLVVWRAEVDGVDVLIDREPDGSVPLLKRFMAPPGTVAPVAAATPATTGTQPVNLQAPLRIDAVRVSGVTTTFRDRSVNPIFQATVHTTLRLSDVGNATDPARFELQVTADPVLDALIVSGEMHNTPTSIDADLSVILRGLHPKPAAVYLSPLGLKPVASDITVKATAKLKANAIPNTADVAGSLAITDISATADTTEWASLKSLTLDAKKVNPSAIELGKLLIETGRASACRSQSGAMQIAGFELVSATAVASTTQPAASPPPVVVASAAPAHPIRASLDELTMSDLQATFTDQAVTPAGAIVARLDGMTVKDIVYDTDHPDAPIAIDGSASVPGVIKSMKWSGTGTPFGSKPNAALKFTADGIKPDALKPYLDAAGIESQFAAGLFTADLDLSSAPAADGSLAIAGRLSKVRLSDGDATLFDLTAADLKGFTINPKDGAIRVASIDVTGPAMKFSRDGDGALVAAGMRLPPPSAPPGKTSSNVPSSTQPSPQIATAKTGQISLPKIEIGKVTWNEIQFDFEDQMDVDSPVKLHGDAVVEASDLVFDPNAKDGAGKPGKFSASLKAPGLADELAIKGTLEGNTAGAKFATEISGKGITGAAITGYLKPLGVELTLKDGTVKAKAGATIGVKDGAIALDADLADVSYADGETELAGVDVVKIAGVSAKPGSITAELVKVTKPRASVTRNADGTIETAGIRLVPLPPSTQPAVPEPAISGRPAPLKLTVAPIVAMLKEFELQDGSLAINDQTVTPALETVLHGSVELKGVDLANGAPPAKLKVAGALDGIFDTATVDGDVTLSPDAPGAKLTISADKIRGDAIAGYLPPGMIATIQDGHFAMALDAGLANHEKGGLVAHLAIDDLVFENGAEAKKSLAKVGSFVVRAARIDPAGEVIEIDEISSDGVELDVVRQPDLTLDLLGLKFGKYVAPQPVAEVSAPAPTTVPATQPSTQPVMLAATTQPATDVAAMVAEARRPLPLVTVQKLDLKLDHLRLSGLTGPDGKPIDLANVRLHNTGPIELAGANADQRPPVKLQIDGGIDPVVKVFGVAIESSPLAAEPAMTINVTAKGISGKGLIDVAPELASTINGDGLTDGSFNTNLTASLNYGRRGPRDLDLMRGFTGTFNIKPLEFRGTPDGPILAGVAEVHGEGIVVKPKTGDVTIKSIDVTKPIGEIVRDDKGIHALGFVIPLKAVEPATGTGAVADASSAPPTTISPAAVAAATPGPAARPANEIRVDRFDVTGIDLVFEDRTAAPVTRVPLKTLDLDVRDISNQMLWTGKPMRFDMLCTADKVPLPPRKGAAAGPATQTAEGYTEMRELFSQVTASGRVGMKQTKTGVVLTGWAKTSVSGFEILGVRGLAEPIKIAGGVFDDTNDIRFKDDGSIETRNKIVLTNLSMTEPANGPIQQMLKLPTPLDVGINAITDPDGSITMNLPVTVKSGAVNTDELLAPAVGAIAGVFATAIASTPVKLVDDVGGLFGIKKGEQKVEQPIELSFLPGVATLEAAQAVQLAALAKRMKKEKELQIQIRHELSPADVSHISGRANPPVGDVQVMTQRLRQARAQLLSERAALAAQTRVQFAAQSPAAGDSMTSLRGVDRQLSQIDSSLEQLYELLRPGADAKSETRTRAASVNVARDRFDVLQAALTSAGVPDAANRIRRTNPQPEAVDMPAGGRVLMVLVPKKK